MRRIFIELSDEELHACAPNVLPIAPKKVIVSAFNLKMGGGNREKIETFCCYPISGITVRMC